MAPTSHVYLDYYQSKDQNAEPLAIGGFLPLETVYSFEPVPAELEPQYVKHVLGGQANCGRSTCRIRRRSSTWPSRD